MAAQSKMEARSEQGGCEGCGVVGVGWGVNGGLGVLPLNAQSLVLAVCIYIERSLVVAIKIHIMKL